MDPICLGHLGLRKDLRISPLGNWDYATISLNTNILGHLSEDIVLVEDLSYTRISISDNLEFSV